MATLTDVKKVLRSGLARVSYSPYDADGNLVKFDGTAPTNGELDGNGGTRRLNGARSLPLNFGGNEPVTVNWDGDDGFLDSILYEAAEAPEAIGIVAEFDMDITAALQNTDTSDLMDGKTGVLMPSDPDYPTVILVVQQTKSKSREDATQGISLTAGYIIMNAQIVPFNAPGVESRTATDNQYKVTIGKRTKTPWGTTINDDYSTCEAAIIEFAYEYPIEVQSWRGNGIGTTTFNLAKTPAEASGDKIAVYVDGVAQTYTTDFSVDVTARTMTFVTGPDAGADIVALYQFSAGCS